MSPKHRRSRWLAVDVDGVLASHVTHVLPVLKTDFGFHATLDQIKTWDFPVGTTTFGSVLRAKQKCGTFVLTTPVIEGARDAMHLLFESYNIDIVTARPHEAIAFTEEWLRANDIPYDTFTPLGEGLKHKTTFPCDILIDDYKVNVVQFLKHSAGRAILFSQPWNADHSDLQALIASKRLASASHWTAIPKLVPVLLQTTAPTIGDDHTRH